MVATPDNHAVSADLVGFDDPDAFDASRWEKFERDVLILAAPLAQLLEPKKICSAIDKSRGQLSRELSPNYDNGVSLLAAACITRASQNDKLARVIVCDGLGMTFPGWQRQRFTDGDELRALREECRELGQVGVAVLEGAKKRLRSRR